eukprot:GHVS01081451.1.p1 GENE.GHVS01081451.1~~GHVS01081451.1.p1  ORF type:complete len:432 (-),score=59.55 GHVS01081451.1:262-1533(-)
MSAAVQPDMMMSAAVQPDMMMSAAVQPDMMMSAAVQPDMMMSAEVERGSGKERKLGDTENEDGVTGVYVFLESEEDRFVKLKTDCVCGDATYRITFVTQGNELPKVNKTIEDIHGAYKDNTSWPVPMMIVATDKQDSISFVKRTIDSFKMDVVLGVIPVKDETQNISYVNGWNTVFKNMFNSGKQLIVETWCKYLTAEVIESSAMVVAIDVSEELGYTATGEYLPRYENPSKGFDAAGEKLKRTIIMSYYKTSMFVGDARIQKLLCDHIKDNSGAIHSVMNACKGLMNDKKKEGEPNIPLIRVIDSMKKGPEDEKPFTDESSRLMTFQAENVYIPRNVRPIAPGGHVNFKHSPKWTVAHGDVIAFTIDGHNVLSLNPKKVQFAFTPMKVLKHKEDDEVGKSMAAAIGGLAISFWSRRPRFRRP